jgi:hypothetical protein
VWVQLVVAFAVQAIKCRKITVNLTTNEVLIGRRECGAASINWWQMEIAALVAGAGVGEFMCD